MKKNYNQETEKIDKDSFIPIYYQLAKILERQILKGKLQPGESLASENEIAKKYDISRMTVRKAISELADAGMVYTEKGKGTFVAKPKLEDVVFELKNFHEEIKSRGMQPRTKLLKVKIVRADELLAEKLEVPLNTNCLYYRLLLSTQEEPLIYENKYVVYTKQKPILESELNDPSLSNLATHHGEKFPTMSRRVLHASVANEEEVDILGIELNSPVFVVEQTLYDSDKKPVGWGKSICRGDRFKFTSSVSWSMDNTED
ncbi:transcriptional regulator, GntR family [Candidatus Frackibacter sp. WG12]|uniref:GntR family transcriptional regulator n=1 Tax=unclassified Candidatus Frackibacter TaxID=2648818 RepID=UPI00088DE983|nr:MULTISPECIES: GntR family transcriptional regulator [unclassified Candidatus Frackibacter]SDC27023.1 transcriptional regulator, GntR family [Candidatus Frackibacter sp. WG11]SEM54027.1 transcriptional regulator, GntR family [Candidatus Frackibacter sp. WG12]